MAVEWDAIPSATSFTDRYPALLAACDVVVTDGISMLVEGQVTGRPVIFLEREGHVPFNEAGEVVLRGVHRVSSVTEAREFAERLVRRGDPLRYVQRECCTSCSGSRVPRDASSPSCAPRRSRRMAAGLTGDDEGRVPSEPGPAPSCVGLPGYLSRARRHEHSASGSSRERGTPRAAGLPARCRSDIFRNV